jgi:hypothetical protein
MHIKPLKIIDKTFKENHKALKKSPRIVRNESGRVRYWGGFLDERSVGLIIGDK